MSKRSIQEGVVPDEDRAATENDRLARRRRLADLIGRLLYRTWQERRRGREMHSSADTRTAPARVGSNRCFAADE